MVFRFSTVFLVLCSVGATASVGQSVQGAVFIGITEHVESSGLRAETQSPDLNILDPSQKFSIENTILDDDDGTVYLGEYFVDEGSPSPGLTNALEDKKVGKENTVQSIKTMEYKVQSSASKNRLNRFSNRRGPVSNHWKPINRTVDTPNVSTSRKITDPKRYIDKEVDRIIRRVQMETGRHPKVYRLGPGASKEKFEEMLNFVDRIDSKPQATNRIGFLGGSNDRSLFNHLLRNVWPRRRGSNEFQGHPRPRHRIPRDVAIMEILNQLDASRRDKLYRESGATERRGYGGERSRGRRRRPYKEESESEDNDDDGQADESNNVLSSVTVYTYTPESQRDRGRRPSSYHGSQDVGRDAGAQTPAVVVLDSNNDKNPNDFHRTEQLFRFFRDVLRARNPIRPIRRKKRRLSRSLKALFYLAPFVKIPLAISLLALVPGFLSAFPGAIPAVLPSAFAGKRRRRRSVDPSLLQDEIEGIQCIQRVLCFSFQDLPEGESKIMKRIIRRNPRITENRLVQESIFEAFHGRCREFRCNALPMADQYPQ